MKSLRYTTIFCIFSSGWLLGSLFVLTFIVNTDDNLWSNNNNSNNLRGHGIITSHQIPKPESKTQIFLKKYASKLLPIETPSPTLSIEMIKTLPQFTGISNDDEDGRKIFMDWPVDDKLFTIDNFKALESMLTIFPNSMIRVLLAASRDAYAHKAGNLLSINHFSKYKRKGYNILVHAVYKMEDKDSELGGSLYWKKYQDKCCTKCNAKCRRGDNVQPYHVSTYIRLVKLWKKGGLFSDFSFFFLGAIDSPQVYQGVYMNSFCNSKTDWNGDDIDISNSCYTSTLMIFNVEKSPVLFCVLQKYDDVQFLQCIESDEKYGGANCIQNAFTLCFQSEGIVNDFDISSDANVLETFGDDALKAEHAILTNQNWTIASHKRAFWLGSLAFKSKWTKLPYPEKTLMAAAASNLKLKKNSFEKDPSCQLKCSKFSNELDLRGLSDFKFDNASLTGIEQASCAPSIIIAGFMKSASSFLFSAIAAHPQVIPPLIGAQYKETKCYHPFPSRHLVNRARCFPYIENGESLTSIDGTVLYATDKTIPYLLKQDNPNVKIIFVVRHPVDRLYSFYKFVYRTVYGNPNASGRGSFDDIVDQGITQFSKFGLLRQMVSNKSSDEDVINQYYSNYDGLAIIGSLFMHSIVAPAIMHYMKVLGRENVLVIHSDDLNVNNMNKVREILQDTYKFLGLCPFHLPDMEPILTSRNTVPIEAEMSQSTYLRLNRFFKPFNDLLSQISSCNYSEWNTRLPSPLLPLNSYKNDTNTAPRWFELEFLEFQSKNINGTKKGSIMSHLLPKIQKPDDIGSNTTLGIITMF